MKLRESYTCPLELVHDIIKGELKHFGLIDKKTYDGYPLKVEYFLTGQGEKMLSAIKIMQEIGIDYMVEHGMTEILDEKGICY